MGEQTPPIWPPSFLDYLLPGSRRALLEGAHDTDDCNDDCDDATNSLDYFFTTSPVAATIDLARFDGECDNESFVVSGVAELSRMYRSRATQTQKNYSSAKSESVRHRCCNFRRRPISTLTLRQRTGKGSFGEVYKGYFCFFVPCRRMV